MKLIKFNINSLKLLVLLGAVLFLNQALFSFEYYIISDPTPTVKEGKISYLEEVRTIGEDLGKDQYLFAPFSIAADKSNVFVYDRAQVKVFRFSPDFKLLGSFGSQGQGPGQFNTWGKLDGLQIAIGNDGNIYANNFSALRIIGLDRQGKQLKSIYCGGISAMNKPVADKHGNIIVVSMKNGKIEIKNDKKMILAQCKSEKIHHSFLFEKPGKYDLEVYDRQSSPPNTSWILMGDEKLLVYFAGSSALTIFNGKDYVKPLKLWPKEALLRFKKKYREAKKEKEDCFMVMFGSPIVDQDNKGVFYLQEGLDRNNSKIPSYLYAFNLEGQLLKIIYIPLKLADGELGFPIIRAKVNNIFYTTRNGEEVVLFKEKNK